MEFNKNITIVANPNSQKNEILGYDEAKKAYRVNIKAPPENNKANIEIIKFFTKLSKKKVRIISGKTSKKKILSFS
jgi:uncharacterized protein